MLKKFFRSVFKNSWNPEKIDLCYNSNNHKLNNKNLKKKVEEGGVKKGGVKLNAQDLKSQVSWVIIYYITWYLISINRLVK